MHKLVSVLGGELFAAGADVPLTVEPQSVVGVEYPDANVELSALVQQRVDVLLNNVGLVLGKVEDASTDVADQCLFGGVDGDAVAPIRALPWLEDEEAVLLHEAVELVLDQPANVLGSEDDVNVLLVEVHRLGNQSVLVNFVQLTVFFYMQHQVLLVPYLSAVLAVVEEDEIF